MSPTIAGCNRSITHRALGDFDKVIADFSEAIRWNTNDAEAYRRRGIAYMRRGHYVRHCGYSGRGDLDKAIADFTQVIRLHPKDADVYFLRGTLYRAKGDLDKAISDFAEAIRCNPKRPRPKRTAPGPGSWQPPPVDAFLTRLKRCTQALEVTHDNHADRQARHGVP